ncbi:LacI family DNA-binding transcriptional regulator [uncultured Friedmanniella sp.]|uniref:LacI family DNA-binding transcriptional regulator n=1 Tax=uncultured Friedmanniella sp. TaxID=335381 RepID=UPI0035CB59B8
MTSFPTTRATPPAAGSGGGGVQPASLTATGVTATGVTATGVTTAGVTTAEAKAAGIKAAGIKAAGIKDVAALAGVSPKTVTNVVHERPYVKQTTRARVLAAIEDLDYRPSRAGRQLQSGRSHLITLVVPRIDEPYLASLAHALIAAASASGYRLLIDETGGRPEQEHQAASGYPGHGIDGVIISPFALKPDQLAARSRDVPLVLLGQFLPGSTADYVAIDDRGSAADAVAHLVDRGRRRLGYLGAEPGRPGALGEVRLAGYRRALGEHGLLEPDGGVGPGLNFDRDSGERGAAEMLVRVPDLDGLVCASDLMAIGAVRALQRLGRRVPEDVAVLGWDDIAEDQYVTPTLTTIASDLPALGQQTMAALIRRIEGDRSPGRAYVVPHRLVARASTGGS